MNVLITGGTGSLGQVLTRMLLERGDAVTVFSRDELKQWRMGQRYPSVRFILGDVRDADRTAEACAGADVIIHAAALKHAPAIEGCPDEAIRTNVLGTMNVIRAADGRQILGISSDKACAPITAYGASKLLMERLLVAAGHSAVRLGNIAGSTGSLIPYWRELAAQGKPLPLTDERMTRHWMDEGEAAAFVLQCAVDGWNCIRVPQTRGFRVVDLWRLIGGEAGGLLNVGRRPGEKLHETMIAPDELPDAYHAPSGGYFIQRGCNWAGLRLAEGFETCSDHDLMSVDELRAKLEAV